MMFFFWLTLILGIVYVTSAYEPAYVEQEDDLLQRMIYSSDSYMQSLQSNLDNLLKIQNALRESEEKVLQRMSRFRGDMLAATETVKPSKGCEGLEGTMDRIVASYDAYRAKLVFYYVRRNHELDNGLANMTNEAELFKFTGFLVNSQCRINEADCFGPLKELKVRTLDRLDAGQSKLFSLASRLLVTLKELNEEEARLEEAVMEEVATVLAMNSCCQNKLAFYRDYSCDKVSSAGNGTLMHAFKPITLTTLVTENPSTISTQWRPINFENIL